MEEPIRMKPLSLILFSVADSLVAAGDSAAVVSLGATDGVGVGVAVPLLLPVDPQPASSAKIIIDAMHTAIHFVTILFFIILSFLPLYL